MALKKIGQMLDYLSFSEKEKSIIFKVTCWSIFFLLLLLSSIGVWTIARYYQAETFSEYGIIENLQLMALLTSTFIFLLNAHKNPSFRSISLFLACLTTFCFIRELDAWFDDVLPIVTWKFAWFFPLAGIGYMFKTRKALRKPLFEFLNSGTFSVMVTAVILFIPAAQCIGHRSFITDAIGTSENLINIRRLVEESLELLAYILILLSSVEMFFEFPQKNKN